MSVFSGAARSRPSRRSAAAIPSTAMSHGSRHRSCRPLTRGRRGQRHGHSLPPAGDHSPIRRGAARGLRRNRAFRSGTPLLCPVLRGLPKTTYGPDQLVWARQIKLERDNFLTALANAVDSGDAVSGRRVRGELSPPIEGRGTNRRGTRHRCDTSTRLARSIRRARLSLCAWWWRRTRRRRSAIGSASPSYAGKRWRRRKGSARFTVRASRWRPVACRPRTSWRRGAYADAVSAYARAAELADADGYPGLAAIFLAYKVSCALLGGTCGRGNGVDSRGIRRVGTTLRDARRHRHQPQLAGDDTGRARSGPGQGSSP